MKSNYDLIVELLGYANVNEDFLIDYNAEIQKILDKMVLDEKNIVLYRRLFANSRSKQIIIAIEEMSELQKELCKLLRYEDYNKRNVEEELADVSIMLEQIMVVLNIKHSTIANIREEKLHRTRARLLCENEK